MAISSADRPASKWAPVSGPELAERLHRQPAVALDQHGKRRDPIAIGQLAENLREVCRVLFLEEIRQVCRGADPQKALDGIEDEIDFALRRHTNPLL